MKEKFGQNKKPSLEGFFYNDKRKFILNIDENKTMFFLNFVILKLEILK